MKFFLSILMASVLLTSCASKLGKVLKSKDNEYKLKMAEQYYAQKKYVQAQQVFEDIMPYFRGSDKYEDMFYKYAYCAYNQKDYLNAESLFKTYTENFPNSTRLEECEYMRCYCYYKQSPKVELDQTATSKTISLMQAFINTHPQSSRIKDATEIMDICRAKLELKEFKAAQLYYDMGGYNYRAAAIAFSTLMDDYPDSDKSDEYKLMAIKAYYKYAELSVIDKQQERFEKVISECSDFKDRFTDSKHAAEVDSYKALAENNIKNITK
ncbi:outer membrane protein assembly factor BamD [Panacibacter ginsenosidivorans]|uniref:Outer membrane protein assembly factor BamD n=1 Tax=Panacibacter ginsenosidivorans TaxID=1813871 RepID=A0A5B8V7F5_9BACT|nr:outer membrane protein assembly factor BamD [Panacibacter ginsenosidivorans]QEC67354.1 outer membrane protein assembly factor BamD [Panacibacter ginsenosidivorans]